MKKFYILMVLGITTITYAFAQSFTPSDLKPGKISDNPNRSVTATYVITESNSQSIITGNSVSCNAGGLHTDNHYMRVFDLPLIGITQAINITSVDFGIEEAAGVAVKNYTLAGPLLFANLTPIASQPVTVLDQSLTIMNVPISASIPAGSLLVVEIFTPNGQTAGNSFFIGSNNLGETAPSYLAAPDCGVSEPVTTASLGFPGMHIVMNVYAEDLGPQDVPLKSWPILLGLVLMSAFLIYRFKR
jgi:hypothetical protein